VVAISDCAEALWWQEDGPALHVLPVGGLPDDPRREDHSDVNAGNWPASQLQKRVRVGRLIDALTPAADIVAQAAGSEDVELQVRVLADAFTTRP
jgi:hypothetical protein